ncbi:hypothetical protein GJ496_001841 [Pomphorhynchus laevis]|nr:hypothetical protein GJ496_001841 [Pomphorhynchus laevis]
MDSQPTLRSQTHNVTNGTAISNITNQFNQPPFPTFQHPPVPSNFAFPNSPQPGLIPPINFSMPPPGWIASSTVSNKEDIWIENASPEGKPYYYNSLTRETTWVRPADAEIITQQEFEKSNLQATINEKSVLAELTSTNADATDKRDESNEESKPADQTDKSTNNNVSASDNKSQIMMVPPPVMPIPSNLPALQTPPPWLLAPGGKTIPPPWWPVSQPLPLANHNVSNVNTSIPSQSESDKLESTKKQIQADIDKLKQDASEWTKHTSPEGREYFYSSKTMQSQWIKPNSVNELEEAERLLNETDAKIASLQVKTTTGETDIQVNDVAKVISETQIKSEPTEEELARQRNRPVNNSPVPGSPWCVVWTANARVFFYNPTQKLSVWERPSELHGRLDVDKMISEAPPEVKALLAQKRKAEESENEQTKKPRSPSTEETENREFMAETVIEAGKEAALEAEQKASKERNQIPYDLRVSQFRGMLLEKGVSAFSTWEKELHKIVFDRRYLLLASKERKAVFDKFVKERAEEERVEKATKLRKIKDDFKQLISESVLKSNIMFSEFAAKYAKEKRFRAIDKMRDRESMFNDHINRLRRKERDERYSELDRLRRNFWDLLKERNIANSSTRWVDVKRSLESDPRYKVIESTSRREDWFKEFIREHRNTTRNDTDEKQARIDASIRKRQEEVKEQLSGSLRDREKEREQLRKTEAIENFQVLLMDMVRNSDVDWKQTKRNLKKDCRWDLCKLLGKEEKESLFDQHISALNKKKKDAFYQLLDETEEVSLTSKWKTVKKIIKSDIRYERYGNSDRAKEKEFAQYIKDKYTQAKEEFHQLLIETRIVTYKTLSQVQASDQALKDVEEVLSKDKRFLTLECVPEERRKILFDFLYEIECRGPPPPPTATEPCRRK